MQTWWDQASKFAGKMPRSQFITSGPQDVDQAARFRERLKEIDMFFQGKDRVHETMRRVASRLESAAIPYAIVGGMAVKHMATSARPRTSTSFSPPTE